MRTHTEEKPYKCDVCNKYFNVSSALTTHMRNHTGEKPYQCLVCDKCFKQSGHVTAHMRTHRGEKPYECKDCHKRFPHASSVCFTHEDPQQTETLSNSLKDLVNCH